MRSRRWNRHISGPPQGTTTLRSSRFASPAAWVQPTARRRYPRMLELESSRSPPLLPAAIHARHGPQSDPDRHAVACFVEPPEGSEDHPHRAEHAGQLGGPGAHQERESTVRRKEAQQTGQCPADDPEDALPQPWWSDLLDDAP